MFVLKKGYVHVCRSKHLGICVEYLLAAKEGKKKHKSGPKGLLFG